MTAVTDAGERTYYVIARGAERSGANLTPDQAARLTADGYTLTRPNSAQEGTR